MLFFFSVKITNKLNPTIGINANGRIQKINPKNNPDPINNKDDFCALIRRRIAKLKINMIIEILLKKPVNVLYMTLILVYQFIGTLI